MYTIYINATKNVIYFKLVGFVIYFCANNAVQKTNNVFITKAIKQYLIDFFLVSIACIVRMLITQTKNGYNIINNPPYLIYNHKKPS